MLGVFRQGNGNGATESLQRRVEAGGLVYTAGTALAEDWLARADSFVQWELVYYLRQLIEEGFAPALDCEVILPWDSLYQVMEDRCHQESIALLALPPTAKLIPKLVAQGSLADADFAVTLSWQGPLSPPKRLGGVMLMPDGEHLLTRPQWELAEGVAAFHKRDDRSRGANERDWGRLRRLALAAGARLDDFLTRTVILTLDALDLGMRRVEVGGVPVVELQPRAAGAPEDLWLAAFDKYASVPDHYDLACPDGSLIRVIPDEAVRQVLTEVKRMPGRRVSGKRAQAFLRNPYAVLGEAMATVLPPERFETLRRQAGIVFYAFTVDAIRTMDGRITGVVLALIPEDETAPPPSPQPFNGRDEFARFAKALCKAFDGSEPCFHWRGHDLELRGEAGAILATVKSWLEENWAGPTPLIRAEDVFDLSRYSDRIIGIDVYKPIYSPYIPKTEGGSDGWAPDKIVPMVNFLPAGTTAPVHITLDEATLDKLATGLRQAQADGREDFVVEGLPAPIAAAQARDILDAFRPNPASEPDDAFLGLEDGETPFIFEPPPKAQTQQQFTLVEHTNIDVEEYGTERGTFAPFAPGTAPALPRALRPETQLKPHQEDGVAWLQHLWTYSPRISGCVFADDMGLGKTLQLLTFIHWYFEQGGSDPVLVVAPVSLLENWRNEVRRFFTADAVSLLTLYGKELASVRLPREALDETLRERGLTRFLRPGWLGEAQIVLTTYETLRDQEFSFSAVRWAMVVCDEAQKIKSPNALVTRAAKKQNARFRIACTGTPVENTLTDLWCLFDFVQPRLLGALNQFSRRYTRPIEAHTDEQEAAVEQLRSLVKQQILRRTKQQVADLPAKTEHLHCRKLSMSAKQTALYANILDVYRRQREAAEAAKEAGDDAIGGALLLSMLHNLRMVCADPREAGFRASAEVDEAAYRKLSPKMDWLLKQLTAIQAKNEKVIIFTEFRDIQRLLQRVIGRRFALAVAVINGDTKAQSEKAELSRQGVIDTFQQRDGFNVIVLSTTAVGFGVNIQAANHVIHFTRPWNPAKEDQATDRAYRIGQTREVTVYYPTVTAPNFVSFEEKLDHLLAQKRLLAGDMLNGSDEISAKEWEGLDAPDGSMVVKHHRVTGDMLRHIQPVEFEKLCGQLWSLMGHTTYSTPSSGDGGIDLVAIKGNEGALIQCKTTSKAGRELGWEGVKDVIAGAAAYRARHPDIRFTLAVAANGVFNGEARRQATINHVVLVESGQIAAWLATYTVMTGDL